MNFNGVIKAKIIEVRFASSGKVSKVNKFAGDKVSKGELIASLDRKVLQSQLDRQLADYEKTRADFEIFSTKYPNPTEIIDKYLKTEKQATLNASVKEVEIAKAALDECDLFSPVDGTVLDDSSIVPGVYITPAGATFKIIDLNSFYVEFEINQKDFPYFRDSKLGTLRIESVTQDLQIQTGGIYPNQNKFYVKAPLAGITGLIIGMLGSVEI